MGRCIGNKPTPALTTLAPCKSNATSGRIKSRVPTCSLPRHEPEYLCGNLSNRCELHSWNWYATLLLTKPPLSSRRAPQIHLGHSERTRGNPQDMILRKLLPSVHLRPNHDRRLIFDWLSTYPLVLRPNPRERTLFANSNSNSKSQNQRGTEKTARILTLRATEGRGGPAKLWWRLLFGWKVAVFPAC